MDTNACQSGTYEAGCRLVLDRIGDRWTVLIVGALGDGTRRFSELRDAIGGVTPKVLTQTLRALERDGLLTRKVYAQVPPRVEYTLTDLGRDLITPIGVIRTWAEQHMQEVLAARARHDHHQRP
jgi:DNA-binding HxlR family transcriptional regulator